VERLGQLLQPHNLSLIFRVYLQQALDAVVEIALVSGCRLFASLANQSKLSAVVLPVTRHLVLREIFLFAERALVLVGRASLLVLEVVPIAELLTAVFALELHVLQDVGHVDVGLAARRVIGAAVGTVLLLGKPVVDAGFAIELVALTALDQIRRDNIQAHRAREELVKWLVDGLFRC